MGSPSRFASDRGILECPGPCNPKNKVCRRTCVQNMITILEDLPPCIRSRLRQEDLLSVFTKDQDYEQSCAAANPTGGNPSSQMGATCEGKACAKRSVSDKSSVSTKGDERSVEVMGGLSTRAEDEGTQTIEEKKIQTEQTIRQITSQFCAIASETRTFTQQTEDAAILVQTTSTRGFQAFQTATEATAGLELGIRGGLLEGMTEGMEEIVAAERGVGGIMEGITGRGGALIGGITGGRGGGEEVGGGGGAGAAGGRGRSSCSCSFVRAIIYSGLLITLAIFAKQRPMCEIILSMQICGLIAILSWKLFGTVMP